jgi:hypothetical protein
MKNILSLVKPKKLIIYLIFFGLGIYAGISIIRFKPQLFFLNQIPKDQIEATIFSEKVGKLMSLPTDEQPIIESITDLTPLKDKSFFIKAEVGDKVLIYKNAAMAILYRPSKNMIINILSPNYSDAIFSMISPSPTAVATPVPTTIPTPISTPVLVPTVEPTISPIPTVTPVPTSATNAVTR